MTTAPILETRDLTVRYGSFVAVDRVSLRVAPGEIHGLLGPNGAGKTSVIRALTTIIPISAGEVTVAGHPLSDVSAVRRSIGVLPESNGYPPSQSARAYLRFYGQLFGLGRDEADSRAERLLEQLSLGDRLGRISTFSRGMRQRLGLARALINGPAVLFLDEPTLGLDPAGKDDIMAHLTNIAIEQGTGVILCSHLLDEVERVCDRVSIMNGGQIVAAGTVAEVIESAGVGGSGRIRVAPESIGVAEQALRAVPGNPRVRFDNTRPGDLDVELSAAVGARSELLRILLDAGVEPRSFDLHGARLSDAFRALTGASSSASIPSAREETP
jgi:ABC-2 type transport system ATP-binding protein